MKEKYNKLIEILGENAHIGVVFRAIDEKMAYYPFMEHGTVILAQWRLFGFTKTLQDIEWDNYCFGCNKNFEERICPECNDHPDTEEMKERPKSKDAESLLNYLFEIFEI